MDIKTTKLGHTFTPEQLAEHFKAIYGGIAWPGKRPGFAVVLGMGRDKQCGRYNIYQLDEFEATHLLKLIRHCGVLNIQYRPTRWIGDADNVSADRFIHEMNAESQAYPRDPNEELRHFHVSSTLIMEDTEHPYPYWLDTLQNMLNKDSRQLFLKDSKIVGYLNEIDSGEIADLERGAFPSIEALAMAAIELRDYGAIIDRPRPRRHYPPRSAMC